MDKMEAEIKQIVCDTLKIDESQYNEDLGAGDIPQWDSIGHVTLLQAVEAAFNISFDVGDAIDIECVADLVDTVREYTATGAA
jgi:acyl carrier protein